MKAEGFVPDLDPEVDMDTLFVSMTPKKMADTNPFDGDCYTTSLDRQVNVAQLGDEISEAVGFNVQLSVVNPCPGTPISEDNPATMYIHPPVDGRVVRGKIRSHQIDDLYGLSEDQRARLTLTDKLRRGESLTEKEQATALRLALTQT